MPQEYIDQFLRVGSNTENHRTRIAIEYAKQQPMDNLVDFLEKTYHGGYGLQFGTTKVCAWYAEDGIHLAYGSAARFAKNAQILSWENVAARVGQLLERGSLPPMWSWQSVEPLKSASLRSSFGICPTTSAKKPLKPGI